MIKGTGVSPGIGYAQAILLHPPMGNEYIPRKCVTPALEVDRFEAARRALHGKTQDLRVKAVSIVGDEDAAIFDAYSLILDDEEGLLEPLRKKIRTLQYSAEYAVTTQFAELAREFLLLDDEYMRQRVDDVFSLRDQLMRELMGQYAAEPVKLVRPSIIVAQILGPGDIATLDLSMVEGIICETGGHSSHTAIIARNLGIPTVLAAQDAAVIVHSGDLVALDGETGEIWIEPDEEQVESLRLRSIDLAERTQATLTFFGKPTICADGRRVELAASIGQLEEVDAALASDAESLGLYRTELLYEEYSGIPGEEEQYEHYCKVLEKMGSKNVTVRTFDDGGNPSHLKRKVEANPVLGHRGIRMSLARPSMFRTQLRALLRASANGPLRILFPMVSCPDELDDALYALQRVKQELAREDVPFDENIPVGLYLTSPSSAILADSLAKKVDFLTVGVNDLIQFTMAAERGNSDLAGLFNLYQPAVLRLLNQVARGARQAGVPCFLNGEAQGFEDALPLLLGMGFDGFTQDPAMILRCRQIISCCNYDEWRQKVPGLLQLCSGAEMARQLGRQSELTVKTPASR